MPRPTRRMIGRRSVLAGGASMVAAASLGARAACAALPVPARGELAFRLIRHDSEIGSHTIRFAQQDGVLTVHIDVEAVVKFGPIPLVRYAHHAVEIWTGTELTQLDSKTDKNGTQLWMWARRTETGLKVAGSSAQPYIAPANAMPTTYWNSRLLDSPMIGTQDGMLVHPTVRNLGPDSVPVVAGGEIAATRYGLRGDLDFDLFYDATRTWVGMEFSAADGSVVHYARV